MTRALRTDVEAEMALAEITGLEWRSGQTQWRGHIIAYTWPGRTLPADAQIVLYACDGGARLAMKHVSGVTEQELQYKALAWGIGVVLDAQRAA